MSSFKRKAGACAGAAFLFLALQGAASAGSSVVFQGQTFVNKGLVGVGRVASNALDQYNETLGGFGSSMALDLSAWKKGADGAYTGVVWMQPDRGWNTQGTTNYRSRAQRFEFRLTPHVGAPTLNQDQIALTYRKSLLWAYGWTTGLDASRAYYPRQKDPAGVVLPHIPLGETDRLAVDAEGLVLMKDRSFWVSDEYGPYVYHFSGTGMLIEAIRPPEAFAPKRKNKAGALVDSFSADSPPVGETYNPAMGQPVVGRQNNQGLEGLSLSPDGKTMFALLQSALMQDLDADKRSTTRRNTRLLAYDMTGVTPKLKGEYVVQLPQYQDPTSTKAKLLVAAQSELFALNDHQFLVLARDSGVGYGAALPASTYRSVDLVDISGATNIAGSKYDAEGGSIAPKGVLDPAITPAAYQKFLDVNEAAELAKFNLHNGLPNDRNDLYEKWESLALAPVMDPAAPNDYFLFVASDNDFITQHGRMNGVDYADASGLDVDSMMLVYRVSLPTYAPPQR
ncbi:esterase-like activity of phytase family protein [Methylocella sp.]|uniref:esterase-like activity of phytase family protein n=1 Tax=Methylocella sp. TaxID=1978226 RepID=UPI003783AD1F